LIRNKEWMDESLSGLNKGMFSPCSSHTNKPFIRVNIWSRLWWIIHWTQKSGRLDSRWTEPIS
jgi:hypothetical protein